MTDPYRIAVRLTELVTAAHSLPSTPLPEESLCLLACLARPVTPTTYRPAGHKQKQMLRMRPDPELREGLQACDEGRPMAACLGAGLPHPFLAGSCVICPSLETVTHLVEWRKTLLVGIAL